MASLCFSSASILRCDLYSKTQVIILIIPTVLELFFSIALVFKLWGPGRRQLLLACEGWIYLILAFLDLISHLTPAARHSVNVFRVFDIYIASMSFLPLLLFSLFLCSLALVDFITILPARLRRFLRPFLILFIPIVIGINEVASFIGVSYLSSPTQGPEIVFREKRDSDLWTFFNSLTLALFTAFQICICCFSTSHLTQIWFKQRKIEQQSGSNTPRIGGVGWINAGIIIGVLDTVIGFANAGFGGALARRILRLVSRASFSIGLIIGMDNTDSTADRDVEGDNFVQEQNIGFRRSRLKAFISNPRFSTFHHLSPTATAFHDIPRAPPRLTKSSRPRASAGLPGMDQFAVLKDESSGPLKEQRVTVHFEKGTPKLDLRLSGADFPDPSTFAGSFRATWQPGARNSYRNTVDSTDSVSLRRVEIVTVPRRAFVPEKAKPTVYRTASGRLIRRSVSEHGTRANASGFRGRKVTKGRPALARETDGGFFQQLVAKSLAAPGVQPDKTPMSESRGNPTVKILSPMAPPLVASFHGSTNDEGYVSRPASTFSAEANQQGSYMLPPALANLPSPHSLKTPFSSPSTTPLTAFSLSPPERAQLPGNVKTPSVLMTPNSGSFLDFSSQSTSPTETQSVEGQFLQHQQHQERRRSHEHSRANLSSRSNHTRSLPPPPQSVEGQSNPPRHPLWNERGSHSARENSQQAQTRASTNDTVRIIDFPLPPSYPAPAVTNPPRRPTPAKVPPTEGVPSPMMAVSIASVANAMEMSVDAREKERERLVQVMFMGSALASSSEGGHVEKGAAPGGSDECVDVGVHQKGLERIKSVGKAPQRSTPTPTQTRFPTRESLYIEPIVVSGKQLLNHEVAMQSTQGSTPNTPFGSEIDVHDVDGEGSAETVGSDRTAWADRTVLTDVEVIAAERIRDVK
ncbi:hypothetical protein AX17_007026 [Amanita inopinata Kibby_2008]|nr:hypothetical protein AX17_007026 [Amanita inopinata Kibby_2008]